MGRKVVPYKKQVYKKLKQQCVKSGRLFEDPEFPASAASLFYNNTTSPGDIHWKRPGELVKEPKLIVEGASKSDFSQGSLGNCWFVASCACIAGVPKLWRQIFPDYETQEWTGDDKYRGIFHFQFFKLGTWYDVVVDDLLPTQNDRLLYVRPSGGNGFWCSLLEKAYAKFYGSYEALGSGQPKDALVDMLGGIGQLMKIDEYGSDEGKRMELFGMMLDAFEDQAMMTASIPNESGGESEMDCGLIQGHAYSITNVRRMRIGKGLLAFFKNEKIDMIRLRNPWGKKEWKGAWSDQSEEWKKISDKNLKEMGLELEDNGEFWMELKDFLQYFKTVNVCYLINTKALSLKKKWKETVMVGDWTNGRNGGCANHRTFLENPQYLFDVKDYNSDIKISVEQEDMRLYKSKGKQNDAIGFAIHKADLNRVYRMHDKLEKVDCSAYVSSRSVFKTVVLDPGRYLIIPSTFNPGYSGQFMLRMYSGKDLGLRELTFDEPKKPGCFSCGPKYRLATQLTVQNASGLKTGSNPFCVIKCEGLVYKTSVCQNTTAPVWNWRLTFFKKKVESEITIEVFSKGTIKNQFLGRKIIGDKSKKGQSADEIVGVHKFELQGKGPTQTGETITVKLKQFVDFEEA